MNIGFGGKLSGGKTTTALVFALDFSGQGLRKKLITTVKLLGVKCLYIKTSDLVDFVYKYKEDNEMLEQMFFNSVLLLDEIRNIISARKSTSNLNEVFTQFLMMAGKLDCDILYTYQIFNSQVDVQLREITDMNFECTRTDEQGRELEGRYSRMRIPRDEQGNLIPVRINVRRMEYDGNNLLPTKNTLNYDPMDYAKYFNTREIIILDREKYLKK